VKFPAFFLLVLPFGFFSSAAAQEKPKELEERRLFRPLRAGVCVGVDPGCFIGGLKVEFAGKYVGLSSYAGFLWFGMEGKVYPVGAFHWEKASIRPFAYGAGTLGMGLDPTHGWGLGADVHLLKRKRILLQPQVSYFGTDSLDCVESSASAGPPPPPTSLESCAGQWNTKTTWGFGGSLAVMIAF